MWGIDNGPAISNASSTTVTFPRLTPSGTGELYVGYDAVANTAAAGSTAGFTYSVTSDADVTAYDTNVTGVVQPTATQSPAGVSGGVGVLITASVAAAKPTVTLVNPNTGSTAGGTSVTITGTNFTGASAVKFGATAATTFTVNSATSDHRHLAGGDGYRRRHGDDRRRHQRHERRPTSSPTRCRRPPSPGQPDHGPEHGRNLGDHHRHQPHRCHGREVRRHRGDDLHRQQRHV